MTFDLVIEPVAGEFDVEQLEAYLLAMPHVARDPARPHAFVSDYTRHGLAEVVERLAAGGGYAPSDILILVAPHDVHIVQMASHRETARHFIAWLRARYELRYLDNDYGGEIHDVDDDLVKLFGAVDPPAVAIDWDRDAGFEIFNDPMGIAQDVIAAQIDRDAVPPGDPLPLGAGRHATWIGDAWRVVREDNGEAMLLTPALIDELLRTARAYRHEALMNRFPQGATLDRGRYEVLNEDGGLYESGMFDGRDRARDVPVLVTFGPLGAIDRAQLAYEVPGIAALRHIGPLTLDGEERYVGIVEDRPPGTAERPPLDAASAARLGIAIGEIVAAAHARGIVLVGLQPDRIYTEGERITGIAPRCHAFGLDGPTRWYVAPEVIAGGPPTPAADVFSLASTISYLHTHDAPFVRWDAERREIIVGERVPWRGDVALGAIVDRGLAPVEQRATLAELLASLRNL